MDLLLTRWTAVESNLLHRYATFLRAAEEKAWNVYSVFLTPAKGNESQNRLVRWIDENLERTRKIAADGIETREDVIRALLPLMPIQYRPSVDGGDYRARVHSRISLIAPMAADAIFNEDLTAADIVALLRPSR